MLSAFTPKPPVPAVPKACTMLSNSGMPPIHMRMICNSVMPT